MARMDAERSVSGVPWWIWLIVAVMVLVIIGLAAYFLMEGQQTAQAPFGQEETVEGTGGEPQAGAGPMDRDRDTVMRQEGMPRQLVYEDRTYTATDVVTADERNLIPAGPYMEGREVYYEQGAPTDPYRTIFLRGQSEENNNVFVSYHLQGGEEHTGNQ